MPQDVVVDLGSFTVSSYLDKNFVLAVSTTALLSLPDQFNGILTAAELRDQVKSGSLWVTRAGACHIELNISLGDSLESSARKQVQDMVVEAFEGFPGWKALGLDLRRDYNQFNDDLRSARSLYPYSVHHDQQNAGLIAPEQVPCAYFTVLSCNFTFAAVHTASAKVSSNSGFNTPQPEKSMVVTLKVPPRRLRTILGLPEIYSLPLEAQGKRLKQLTDAAMHSILGSRKRFSGIQVVRTSVSPTVLEVAPAVWSFRYFQEVVSRARMVPLISSPLGALNSTESPSLLHKLQNFTMDPAGELHQQMLVLILRSARVPKIGHTTQLPRSNIYNTPDSEGEDDRSNGPGEVEHGCEVPDARENIHQASTNYDMPPSVGSSQSAQEDDPSMEENHTWPAHDHVHDGAPFPEHDWPYPDSGFSSNQDGSVLWEESAELASDSMTVLGTMEGQGSQRIYDTETSSQQLSGLSFDDMDDVQIHNADMYSLDDPADWDYEDSDIRKSDELTEDSEKIKAWDAGNVNGDIASRQQHGLSLDDTDNDHAEDVEMYPLDEPIAWDNVHPDSHQASELINDWMSDVEAFETASLNGMHGNDNMSQQHHGLYLDGLDGYDLNGNNPGDSRIYAMREPSEWDRGHQEQNLQYENDVCSDDLMSDSLQHYLNPNSQSSYENLHYEHVLTRAYGGFTNECCGPGATEQQNHIESESVDEQCVDGLEQRGRYNEQGGGIGSYASASNEACALYGQGGRDSQIPLHHRYGPYEDYARVSLRGTTVSGARTQGPASWRSQALSECTSQA